MTFDYERIEKEMHSASWEKNDRRRFADAFTALLNEKRALQAERDMYEQLAERITAEPDAITEFD